MIFEYVNTRPRRRLLRQVPFVNILLSAAEIKSSPQNPYAKTRIHGLS
jgi:hypothetical protein